MRALYKCFTDKDALLAEINPLVVTDDGDIIALDCKMTFDDNSLFRQGGVAEKEHRPLQHPDLDENEAQSEEAEVANGRDRPGG